MMMLSRRIQFIKTFNASNAISKYSKYAMDNKRSITIHVQLDYHPGAQYAGLLLALKNDLYTKQGINVVLTKASQDGGDEPQLVIEKQAEIDRSGDVDSISIGRYFVYLFYIYIFVYITYLFIFVFHIYDYFCKHLFVSLFDVLFVRLNFL